MSKAGSVVYSAMQQSRHVTWMLMIIVNLFVWCVCVERDIKRWRTEAGRQGDEWPWSITSRAGDTVWERGIDNVDYWLNTLRLLTVDDYCCWCCWRLVILTLNQTLVSFTLALYYYYSLLRQRQQITDMKSNTIQNTKVKTYTNTQKL